MFRNMNKLDIAISKFDIVIGLIISAVIIPVFSIKVAIVYLCGVIVSIINYLISSLFIRKYLLNNGFKVAISTFVRIILVSALVIPLINDIKLILAYLIGFIFHYINLIICTIYKKGSA